jgi:hypothetical protein
MSRSVTDEDKTSESLSDEELRELRDNMSVDEVRKLAPVLLAIRRWVDIELNPDSNIASLAFSDRFALAIRVFHALHDPGEVFTKKTFEYAFKDALQAAGAGAVELTADPTFSGRDLVIGGKTSVSLKTEAARGIRGDRITISKLMESAWTKDCRTAADFLQTIPRILAHLASYDRIFVLRAFGRLSSQGTIRYELWEIPRGLLERVSEIKESHFSRLTGAFGTTATVYVDEKAAFKLVFDGSDQKITLRGLLTDLCVWHGSWTISNG